MQGHLLLRRRERRDEGVSRVLNRPGGDAGLLQREEPGDYLPVCRDATERLCQGPFCSSECVLPPSGIGSTMRLAEPGAVV